MYIYVYMHVYIYVYMYACRDVINSPYRRLSTCVVYSLMYIYLHA